MATATAAAAATSYGRWSDLPFDLLRDISHRLHVATDYVRFHAVCKAWRASLPPLARRPAFLPWLLTRRDDDTGHRKARCVFSSKPSSNGQQYVRDHGWVIAAADGAAACCLHPGGGESNGFADPPLVGFGSATSLALPPYPDDMKSWVKRASGMVTGDGTVFLHAIKLVATTSSNTFRVNVFWALLHPGDAAWLPAKRNVLHLSGGGANDKDIDGTACIAYHDGKIVLSSDLGSWNCWTIASVMADDGNSSTQSSQSGYISGAGGSSPRSYLVESRGELLLAIVRWQNMRHMLTGERRSRSKQDKVVVSVRALRFRGRDPDWGQQRDGRSFSDRILFLGRLGSFAVDAARFGNNGGGGCAYFVDHVKGCHVYKYNFLDGTSELVEQLPEQWNNDFCFLWLTPKPVIASNEEIREKLQPAADDR